MQTLQFNPHRKLFLLTCIIRFTSSRPQTLFEDQKCPSDNNLCSKPIFFEYRLDRSLSCESTLQCAEESTCCYHSCYSFKICEQISFECAVKFDSNSYSNLKCLYDYQCPSNYYCGLSSCFDFKICQATKLVDKIETNSAKSVTEAILNTTLTNSDVNILTVPTVALIDTDTESSESTTIKATSVSTLPALTTGSNSVKTIDNIFIDKIFTTNSPIIESLSSTTKSTALLNAFPEKLSDDETDSEGSGSTTKESTSASSLSSFSTTVDNDFVFVEKLDNKFIAANTKNETIITSSGLPASSTTNKYDTKDSTFTILKDLADNISDDETDAEGSGSTTKESTSATSLSSFSTTVDNDFVFVDKLDNKLIAANTKNKTIVTSSGFPASSTTNKYNTKDSTSTILKDLADNISDDETDTEGSGSTIEESTINSNLLISTTVDEDFTFFNKNDKITGVEITATSSKNLPILNVTNFTTSRDESTSSSTQEFRSSSTEESPSSSTENSTSGSTEESTSSSTIKSTNDSTEETTSGSIKESTSNSTNEFISSSTEEITSGSTKESTSSSTENSTSGSTEVSTSSSLKKSTNDSTEELTSGSTKKSTNSSTEEFISNSRKETTSNSTQEFRSSSTEESTNSSTEDSTSGSTEESTSSSTQEFISSSTEKSTSSSTENSTSGSTEESTSNSTEEFISSSTEETTSSSISSFLTTVVNDLKSKQDNTIPIAKTSTLNKFFSLVRNFGRKWYCYNNGSDSVASN